MKPARFPNSAFTLFARSVKLCLFTVFVLVLLAPTPARSQVPSAGNVLLEPNEQLFCILAAVNAAGYDAAIGSSAPGDTRQVVREYLAAQNAPILPQLGARLRPITRVTAINPPIH